MAVSILTLEINSGIDIWSPESDGTFFALGCPLHYPASLYVGSIPLQVQILITDFCSAVLVHETL